MISMTSWRKKIQQKAVVQKASPYVSAGDGLLKKMQTGFKYLWMLAFKKEGNIDVRNYAHRATLCPSGTNELASTNTFRSNDKIHLL